MAFLTMLVLLGTVAGYLLHPNYFDHVQPSIADASWLVVTGHPGYPDWRTGPVYGLVYGPLLLFVNGAFLWLAGPCIAASKAPGIVCFLSAAGFVYWTMRRRGAERSTAFLLVAVLILIMASLGVIPYSNRADPFLILLTALSLATVRRSDIFAAVFLGVLAGCASGLKLHGCLYILPAVFAVLGNRRESRWRLAAIIGLVAGSIVLLPFVASNTISLREMFDFLCVHARHGLTVPGLLENLLLVLVFVAPIMLAYFHRRPPVAAANVWFQTGMGLAMAIVIVIAAKPGAGRFHLLPFLPSALYALAIMLPTLANGLVMRPVSAAALFFLALLPGFLPATLFWATCVGSSLRTESVEQEKIHEIQQIFATHPDVEMGVSDSTSYPDSYYRCQMVFRGKVPRFDPSTWMDLSFGGVSETNVERYLNGNTVPIWVLPLGEPWNLISLYTQQPLFSDAFRKKFHAEYYRFRVGKHYQLWVRR